MRTILLSLAVLLAACNTAKNSLTKIYQELNGSWKPVQQFINGNALPPASFASQILTLKDSAYTFVAESMDKGSVRINGDKMDLYGKEGVNKGKHFTCLWKLENGELAICYNLMGTAYPESYETKGKPGLFFARFRKEK